MGKSYSKDKQSEDNQVKVDQSKDDQVEPYKGDFNKDVKAAFYDIEKDVNIEVIGKYRCLKVNKQQTQLFPVMISVKSEQMKMEENAKEEMTRPPIDLICVIDRSGSMSGEKIALVRKTLNLLLEFLGEKDRLCLIQFDDQVEKLTSLSKVNQQNMPFFESQIQKVQSRGGTNINLGMTQAFQTLKNAKTSNPVTSIFLLSDGLDGRAQDKVQNSLLQTNFKENFTIHTFGFGKDHDPQLMTDIAKLKNGNFYYIEQLDKVDECFIDALGGLVSIVAQDIVLDVQPKFSQPYSDITISQYNGDMWQQKGQGKMVPMSNIISGVKKDFIIELNIPPINQQLGDEQRNANLLDITLNMQDLQGKKIQKKSSLEITFYNEDENVPNYEENPDVQFNYLRLLAANQMVQARLLAEQSKYEEGQKLMDDVEKQLEESKNVDEKKLEFLKKDVKLTKQLCSQSQYQSGGKNAMMQQEQVWMCQKSKGMKQNLNDVDMYENNVQQNFKCSVMKKKGLS